MSEKGITPKNTKQREAIRRILQETNMPLTVDAMFEQLCKEDKTIWFSTIYRNLSRMAEEGTVIKSYLPGENKAYYQLAGEEHKHCMRCTQCQKVVAISDCPFDEFGIRLGKETGFEVTGHNIEIFGICPACQKRDK